jgi:hypothetical protein
MKCIVCRKDLANVPGEENQPAGGVEFTSRGHYGSTAFDPMDGTFLAVNICDDCLTKAAAEKVVLHGKLTISRRVKYEKWRNR